MNRILYHIFGSLMLRCEGGFVNQFLDLCRTGGVAFRNARCKEGKLYIEITPSELYTVRHVARETGMRVKIIKRTGLVFPLHRYRKRYGMIVGFAFFMLIMYHLSGFVWSVTVVGESNVYTQEEILSALEGHGIGVGKRINDIDVSYAENTVLTELNDLKRLAISINATSVTAEISDKILPPHAPEAEINNPADIISSADAYVVSVAPYSGEAAVKPGDTVRKGQVLVSGLYEDSLGRTYLTRAKGEVIGQVTRTTQLEVSVFNEEETLTGEFSKKNTLFFYGTEIKFYFDGGNRYTKCDIISEKHQPTLFGKPLPMYMQTVTERELRADGRRLTDEELEAKVEAVLKKYEETELTGGIVSRSVETELDGEICRVNVTYVCHEDIGEISPINIEQ